MAAKALRAAQGVLFANAHLAEADIFEAPGQPIPLEDKRRIGVGYPSLDLSAIEEIKSKRAKEQEILRAHLLPECAGKKVLVYFGGNGALDCTYFTQAFPAFLQLLTETIKEKDLSSFAIVIQQHPGAKPKKVENALIANWEKDNLRAPQIVISNFTANEAQIIADTALYFQTTMNTQFVLVGLPTLQVGLRFEDILVRNKLIPSITTSEEFIPLLNNPEQKAIPEDKLFDLLGIKSDWLETLTEGLQCTD